MKKILSSTLVLVCITLIAGLALATVYEVTKAPIATAEEAARQNAYRMVLPDAKGFIATGHVEASMYPVEMENGVKINDCLVGTSTEPKEENSASSDYEIVGYVVNVTSPNGYGGDITMAVGLRRDGATVEIVGISVIAQGETAGLGAVCAEKSFADQFVGIRDYVEYVKNGKTDPHEIDAISGATITTRAVTEAVNAAMTYVREIYIEGGNG